MKKIIYAIWILVIGLGLSACGKQKISFGNEERNNKENITSEEIEKTEVDTTTMQEACDEFINVYVCGAVNNPGVYTLSAGALVDDVIMLAGGFSDNASRDYLNLARKLVDGEKIYVPCKEELDAFSNLTEESVYQESPVEEVVDNSKININAASESELTSIPGVGPSRAKDIIVYRESHGAFKSIEDIKNVPGIKDGVFNKIKDYITI